MKPAHCWKVLGPKPLTSLSCSRFINGPFFSRHSIIFLALLVFSPAMCLRENLQNTFFSNEQLLLQVLPITRTHIPIENLVNKTLKLLRNRQIEFHTKGIV